MDRNPPVQSLNRTAAQRRRFGWGGWSDAGFAAVVPVAAVPPSRTGLVCLLTILLTSACSPPDPRPVAPLESRTYVTSDTLEPDKLASIWLIKRHVDKEARFEFAPGADRLPPGIPFDVPQAEYRRYANHSCFEFILHKHGITDPILVRIGALIHDLEINHWGPKRFPESLALAGQLSGIVQSNSVAPEVRVQQALEVFDRLAESLRTGPAPGGRE